VSSLYLPSDAIPARFGRVPSLDGLRALSVMIVMASHLIDHRVFPGGFGVLVFFVLSGFLITRLLFAEQRSSGTISLTNFYIRRLIRLYPALVVYTVLVLGLWYVRGRPIAFIEPLSTLFYFANYYYAFVDPTRPFGGEMPFSEFWSLSVEEHFYLIFPLLFVWAMKRPNEAEIVKWVALSICVVSLVLRILLAYLHPDWLSGFVFYYSELRADSIAYGVLIAALCETDQGRQWLVKLSHPICLGVGIVLLISSFAIRAPLFRETIRYSMQGGAVGIGISALLFSPRYEFGQRILNHRFVVWIGTLSYSLYIWHYASDLVALPFASDLPRYVLITLWFAISFALASLSFYFIERPTLSLRRRFGSR
jgi:peptidoglycan/LPS O-acetylase OafA/YrhL